MLEKYKINQIFYDIMISRALSNIYFINSSLKIFSGFLSLFSFKPTPPTKIYNWKCLLIGNILFKIEPNVSGLKKDSLK